MTNEKFFGNRKKSQESRLSLHYALFLFAGLIPSLTLQQHRATLQRQKREQELREQRELERGQSPKKKTAAGAGGGIGGGGGGGSNMGSTSSLLCARKSNKRKRMSSPFKRGEGD